MGNYSAVIMSVYRKDRLYTLRQAMESLFQQTMQNFDIFIQEDGTVPEEVDIYLDSLYENKKIKYLGKRTANMGLAYSLNELLQIVLAKSYTYIIRFDSDDICMPERFALQCEFMDKHPEYDIVGAWMLEFNENTHEEQIVRYPETHEEIFRFMAKRCPMAHMTVVFRREFFDKAGVYPTHTIMNEDGALWFNGFKSGCRFYNLQLPLVRVRTDDSFFSRRAGFRKAISDFMLKYEISRTFSFGLKGIFFAFAYGVLLLLPPRIKKICYRILRD